jgi:DNA-binding transcriptional MerR regulator
MTMRTPPSKSETAFRTIGEVSADLGIPQHVLRYWESRFPQVKPLQRAGNRRYYRPDDIALLRRIQRLLDHEGYSIRGVQKLLASKAEIPVEAPAAPAVPVPAALPDAPEASKSDAARDELVAIRALLADALARA